MSADDPMAPLKSLAGRWKWTAVASIEGREMPWGEGVTALAPICAGRALRGTDRGSYMGQAVESEYFLGWDSAERCFYLLGVSSVAGMPIRTTGQLGEGGATLVFDRFETEGPDGDTYLVALTIRLPKDDRATQTSEVYSLGGQHVGRITVELTRAE